MAQTDLPTTKPNDPGEAERLETAAIRATSKARADLIMSQPFFGALALRLGVAADWSTESAWVDGVTLGVNPGYWLSMSHKERVAVVAHEVMHCALAHHVRRGDREDKTWNDAADYAINGVLERAGFELPDGVLTDPSYDGMSAEAIYTKIFRKPKQDPSGGGGKQPQGGQGRGQGQGQGQGQQSPQGGQQGGGKPNPTGTVRDAPGAAESPAVATEQAQQWATAAAQAAQTAKAVGKLHGDLEELVAEGRKPKVDWREQLRDFVKATSRDDYTWMRPNRRFIWRGIYLPSAYSEKVGKIGVVVDTSASVGKDELEALRGELESVFGEVKPEALRVIQCDSKIQSDVTLDPEQDTFTFDAKGRGGTRMEPAFKRIDDDPDEYECLICMSDMELFSWPDEPACPVLWVSTGGGKKPPYGELIVLDVVGQ